MTIHLESVACELCGARDVRELFRAEAAGTEFPLVRCLRCGLVYGNPRPDAASMGRFYPPEYYGEGANKFRGWIERLRIYGRRRLADSLARRLPRRAAVLDYGCGRGQMLRLLTQRGLICTGIERTDEAAAVARAIRGVSVFTGPEATAALPDGFFDLVLFLHALEHLPHPLAALHEAHRVLKPTGQLYIAAPNINSFQAIFGGRHWFHLELPRHLYHFSPETLRAALEATGFRILHVGHFSLDQNPFGLLQTELNRLGFLRNHLYEALKSGRAAGLRITPTEALCAAVLSYPALILSTLGSLYQRGATVTVRARRKG